MLTTLLLGATMIINSGPAGKADDSPFLTNMQTSESYTKVLDGRLKHARELLDQLNNLKEKPTVENALSVYDNILLELDAAGAQAGLMENVHPDSVMRASSEIFSQKVSAFNNDLSLNRKVYEALAGIDQTNLDAQTKYYLQKTLRDFKLSGVDKNEDTRAKITELRKELVLISQDFARNIRDDVRLVYADNVKELDGLPQDYIDRHKPEQ